MVRPAPPTGVRIHETGICSVGIAPGWVSAGAACNVRRGAFAEASKAGDADAPPNTHMPMTAKRPTQPMTGPAARRPSVLPTHTWDVDSGQVPLEGDLADRRPPIAPPSVGSRGLPDPS